MTLANQSLTLELRPPERVIIFLVSMCFPLYSVVHINRLKWRPQQETSYSDALCCLNEYS